MPIAKACDLYLTNQCRTYYPKHVANVEVLSEVIYEREFFMKCCSFKQKKGTMIIVSLLVSVLVAVAVYCIHEFLLNKDELEESSIDDDEFIDENGVCYTDETNFVDFPSES